MRLSEDCPVRELPRHQVRELVCTYRPARAGDGRILRVASLILNTPRLAADVFVPLIADHTVEVFGVACLSAKHRLLAWHLVSRGTRDSTPISLPDVFVPACVTPGTVAVIVVHNHPSGDPHPSREDVALTRRLSAAGQVLDLALLDHLIVGESPRYFSFREAGLLGATPTSPSRITTVAGPHPDDVSTVSSANSLLAAPAP